MVTVRNPAPFLLATTRELPAHSLLIPNLIQSVEAPLFFPATSALRATHGRRCIEDCNECPNPIGRI